MSDVPTLCPLCRQYNGNHDLTCPNNPLAPILNAPFTFVAGAPLDPRVESECRRAVDNHEDLCVKMGRALLAGIYHMRSQYSDALTAKDRQIAELTRRAEVAEARVATRNEWCRTATARAERAEEAVQILRARVDALSEAFSRASRGQPLYRVIGVSTDPDDDLAMRLINTRVAVSNNPLAAAELARGKETNDA